MEKQPFIDRILETENLTDELEDSDANFLIDWGVSQLDKVLQGVDDPDAAGTRVNNLMAVMRKINRILGSYTRKDPQKLAKDLASLRVLYAKTFPQAAGVSFAPPEDTSQDLSKLPPRQALEYLTKMNSG